MKVLRNGQDSALLYCVTPPDEKQRAGIYNFLKKKYGYIANLEIIHNESLINGFVLVVGNEVYDWSARGRIGQLKESLNSTASGSSKDDIISLLREKVESFELSSAGREIGTVVSTGDGIAEIAGLKEATYGEIILFDSGVKGMIQELNRDSVGCILFENDGVVMEGSQVICTGKVAGVPVGSAFLGRVVNALGAPIDGLGDITSDDYRMIESPAPGIVDRKPISEPLDTGLLVIDSMFPIGRGQRELIIGDRQTGKTSIALDTIINQKGKDVICVYVAVGQKASSVAHTVEMLRRYDALKYTIVVNASASESASMQYLAPYAGCAFAEYFMYRGADVLIVYDDLSKHAVAYRAISLLLGRSPGREAYPGDVFYLHSRLLERSARLSDELGGGSMTALPIVETQAGDVSAYIPTNIISITDGQIFLESDLFFSGQRPAVNIGLSVSRVGGAAQTQAMKSAAGAVRLDLAQYREMEVFTQFAGDLDDAAREQLNYGQGLMYLLRQLQFSAMTLYEQVITLICGVNRVMIKIPPSKIKSFQKELLDHFMNAHPDICGEIETGNAISEERRSRIIEIAKEFLESVSEHYIS